MYYYMGDLKSSLIFKDCTIIGSANCIAGLFFVMNIPIIVRGIKELNTLSCKPHIHFLILCDSFATN
jgi:hypothetical protein